MHKSLKLTAIIAFLLLAMVKIASAMENPIHDDGGDNKLSLEQKKENDFLIKFWMFYEGTHKFLPQELFYRMAGDALLFEKQIKFKCPTPEELYNKATECGRANAFCYKLSDHIKLTTLLQTKDQIKRAKFKNINIFDIAQKDVESDIDIRCNYFLYEKNTEYIITGFISGISLDKYYLSFDKSKTVSGNPDSYITNDPNFVFTLTPKR